MASVRRVLLLGGYGAIGRLVVRSLVSQALSVTVLGGRAHDDELHRYGLLQNDALHALGTSPVCRVDQRVLPASELGPGGQRVAVDSLVDAIPREVDAAAGGAGGCEHVAAVYVSDESDELRRAPCPTLEAYARTCRDVNITCMTAFLPGVRHKDGGPDDAEFLRELNFRELATIQPARLQGQPSMGDGGGGSLAPSHLLASLSTFLGARMSRVGASEPPGVPIDVVARTIAFATVRAMDGSLAGERDLAWARYDDEESMKKLISLYD